MNRRLPSAGPAALAAAAMLVVAAPARADGEHRNRVALLPAYVQECGACHVAFAPSLLPAESWQRLMGQLGRHFGSDATLDAPTLRALSAWLAAHAGGGKRAAEAPPEDRITLGRWFRREHRDVLPQLPSAASPAAPRAAAPRATDCAACHTRAAEGRFGEREIRLPVRG